MSGYFVEDIAAGAEHTLALTSSGDVFGWGSNSDGQLGVGHATMVLRQPTLITALSDRNIKQV